MKPLRIAGWAILVGLLVVEVFLAVIIGHILALG